MTIGSQNLCGGLHSAASQLSNRCRADRLAFHLTRDACEDGQIKQIGRDATSVARPRGPQVAGAQAARHWFAPGSGANQWCPRPDLNQHALRQQILSLPRLPFHHWGSREEALVSLLARFRPPQDHPKSVPPNRGRRTILPGARRGQRRLWIHTHVIADAADAGPASTLRPGPDSHRI